MTILYNTQTFLSLSEFVTQKKAYATNAQKIVDQIAHPIDRWIFTSLNSTPVKGVISQAVDVFISFVHGEEMAQSITIDQTSFPDLYDVISHCVKTLDIPFPHAVARHTPTLFNAYTAGTENYSIMVIETGLCHVFPKDEACFVIGHECGHIAAGHALYLTVINALTLGTLKALGWLNELVLNTVGLPLLAWSRRAEITADRAGLLCCGNIDVAQRALLRLVLGFERVEQVDIDDYLDKYEQVEEFHKLGMWKEWFASHPMIPKRIEALRLFAESEIYYTLTGQTAPPGKRLLNRDELNQRVSHIVRP